MEWDVLGKRLLKSELRKNAVTLVQLKEKLARIGIEESVTDLNRKINRGNFTFIFVIQCLVAIGIEEQYLEKLSQNILLLIS